ncbi:MAG: hypothetical protein WC603_00920 [Candidatus Paceibacterota bacterium]|jgi:hypothetical protein
MYGKEKPLLVNKYEEKPSSTTVEKKEGVSQQSQDFANKTAQQIEGEMGTIPDASVELAREGAKVGDTLGTKEDAFSKNEMLQQQMLDFIDKQEKHAKELMSVRQKIADSLGQVFLGKSSVGNFFATAKEKIPVWAIKPDFEVTMKDLENIMAEASKDNYLGSLSGKKDEKGMYHAFYQPEKNTNWNVEKTGLTN